MSLEQLQDYALQLENDKQVNDQALADRDNEIKILKDINLDLQKRNKDLFLKVEQQPQADPVPSDPTDDPNNVETIEDVVKNKLLKEIKL